MSSFVENMVLNELGITLDDFKQAQASGDAVGYLRGVLLSKQVVPPNVATTSSDLTQVNDSAFSDSQLSIIQQIASNPNLTDEEKNEYYASIVSDNYSDNNATTKYKDGTEVDNSEMTLLQKTKLDGKFRTKDYNGVRFDYFGKNAKKGDTKEVCGGTITYKGQGTWGAKVDVANGTWNSITSDYIAMTDEQRGTIVHYEGVLGSFDYNTRDWELSYYEANQNGNVISVPVLHYKGDDGVNLVPFGTAKITDGCKIHIPEGLEIGDYMFVDTNIVSMPDLTECSTLKSAHCMFMDCKSMKKAGPSARSNGVVKYPPNLEDISWMFAGSGMTEFFGELGEKTMDARCAAQDCTELGHVPNGDAKSQAKCSFKMPNMTKARYLVGTYCDDMFDNSNTDVEKIVMQYCDANRANPGHISAWSDEKGAHNNIFDKVNDGSYDFTRIQMIANEASKREVLQMVDPSAQGMTGVESDTAGFMTTAVQLTDGGEIQDASTWASLRQTDKTYTATSGNSYGELIDRGVAFAGTFGLLSAVTKNKWISLAGAAVPQFVGFGNKITPILDKVSDWLGEDNKIGQFLSDMSDKLKLKTTSYHTPVEELDIEEVFEKQQTASARYAINQIDSMLVPDTPNQLYDEDGYVLGAEYDVSKIMYENGRNIAKDGNLITIAMTPEKTFANSLNNTLMSTAVDGICVNLKEDIGTKPISAELKNEYSNYFMTLYSNLNAYSEGAISQINDTYIVDEVNKDKALNGLSKVMRNTCEPVYETIYKLQTDYKLFSAEQLAELDKNVPYGMPKFSEYTPDMVLTPEVDKYVVEHENNKLTLKTALENATTEKDYQAAYDAYFEASYGYLMDESEEHNVVLDKDKTDEANKTMAERRAAQANTTFGVDTEAGQQTDYSVD